MGDNRVFFGNKNLRERLELRGYAKFKMANMALAGLALPLFPLP